jgi:prepilin-type processing-associated H-X9-DG protein
MPTTTAAPNAKTSGMAIASLVLGILGFCTLFITAPLAMLFGISAISTINYSQGKLKGKGFAIAGISISSIELILAIFILMPALARMHTISPRIICAVNLKRLGASTIMYANNNKGQYPTSDKWCDSLIKYDPDLNKKMFRCNGDIQGPSSYAMNKNIEKLEVNPPPDMVLLFESKPGWNLSGGPELLTTENHHGEGCNILFCDGHTKFVFSEDINSLRWTAGP